VKRLRTIFNDQVGLRSHKKCARTRYADVVFSHPVGSAGHIVGSGASVCETSMHYFSSSSGPSADPTKSTSEHVSSNLYFLHPWDPWVT
jgi:hypothetical protein